ncbi:hypothetical protein E1264_12310 [Actinomadura sp. KC216]|uniref:hypothetical protein n=1 Tax=Actinomadura sp. KC216 TaxID=2530370 RepID=UPI0010536D43|nr:hypothetical protein [Actinomadura sp. KC216]TDB88177.1 hypothetical protein E1264_12310 [Actinomadura sp. KC216]
MSVKHSPSGLPWPEEWSLPRVKGPWRIVLAAVVGVPSLLIGIGILSDPAEDQFVGWVFLMLVAICATVPVWMRLGRGRDAVFSGQGGVVFPNRRSAGLAIPVTLVAGGTSAVLLTLTPESESAGDPILLVCGLLMLTAAPVSLLLFWRNRAVVLTPEIILVSRALWTRVVPWESIQRIAAYEVGKGPPLIGLFVQDESKPFGKEVNLSLLLQKNDPALLLYAILHYAAHPGDRAELAGVAGVQRVVSGDLRSLGSSVYQAREGLAESG